MCANQVPLFTCRWLNDTPFLKLELFDFHARFFFKIFKLKLILKSDKKKQNNIKLLSYCNFFPVFNHYNVMKGNKSLDFFFFFKNYEGQLNIIVT